VVTKGPEFVIKWDEERQRFVPADVHVEMHLRASASRFRWRS
jgi:hypothetical protein